MKLRYCILFILAYLLTPRTGFTEISINWNFDSGSLGSWEQQDNTILLHLSEEGGSLWYYFRITGVLNQTLTFEIQSPNTNFYGEHKIPVISYDNQNWMYLYQRTIYNNNTNASDIHYQFTHTFTQDEAWIAYTPPYNNTRLDQWIQTNQESDLLEIINLGNTKQERTLPILKIATPEISNASQTTWVILCREDSYETASTWFGIGVAEFLLSEEPLAQDLLSKSQWLIIPIFDRDGVAGGHALHPDPILGPNYFWTEAWAETIVSFHEQRLIKSFLQSWKDSGNTIDGFFRIHSNGWQNNVIRPEQVVITTDEPNPTIDFFQSFNINYLPWFSLQDPLNSDTRISSFIHKLFSSAKFAFIQTDYVFPSAFNSPFLLYKSTHDIMTEGEQLVRNVANHLGITPRDIPPKILSPDIYAASKKANPYYHVRCVYQDPLNRSPAAVQFRLNEETINLSPISPEEANFKTGVIFSGFVNLPPEVQSASFYANNGETEKEIEMHTPQFFSQ